MTGYTEQAIQKFLQVLTHGLTSGFNSNLEAFAIGLSAVAAALRKEGLSEGQIRAALLAICGVQVDDSLVRRLTIFR